MPDFSFAGQALTTRRPSYYGGVTLICTTTELSAIQRAAVTQDTLLVLQNKPDYNPVLGVFGRAPGYPIPGSPSADYAAWLLQRVTMLPSRTLPGGRPTYPFAWYHYLHVEASKWQGVAPWLQPTNNTPPPGLSPNTPGVHLWGRDQIRHVAPGSLAGQHKVWAVTDIRVTP